ncbi:MAG: ATP-binding protein [Rhodospirillaceae bacterium]|nr:ATP-binding protein [Rhodospirillaceae bacterium]
MMFNPVRCNSISIRLVAGAMLWLAIALAVTFFLLTGLFRNTVTKNFDTGQLDHIDELLSLTQIAPDGSPSLKRHPVDPRYVKLHSGWYWSISSGDKWHEQSRSLGSNRLTTAPAAYTITGDITAYRVIGPGNIEIRVVNKAVTLPGTDRMATVLLAGPTSAIETAVQEFNGTLLISLLVLGCGLLFAVAFQVHFGLGPLRSIQRALAEVRTGRAARLGGNLPLELAPLASELNALLDHNEQSIERTRTQVGNLAHSLKTPIAVLKNASEKFDGERGDVIREQVSLMSESVSHHLARARVAGTAQVIGARTPVRPVVEGLQHTLAKIYADNRFEIDVDIAGNIAFRGERQDLEEMLGNLMENACKWGRQRISVRGVDDGENLLIEVADDGPGICPQNRRKVLGRGQRLDETTPGSGLGLPIVRDIAQLYGGVLDLAESSLGGVSARLHLPKV